MDNLNPIGRVRRAGLALALAVSLVTACAQPNRRPGATPTVGPAAATSTPSPPPGAPRLSTPSPAGKPDDGVRLPVVAGKFYPADPNELANLVDRLLAEAEPVDGAPTGLVVPHAGYAYSGPVAAAGFRQLAQASYDLAVVIASDHQMPLSRPISVWAEGGFATPLGVVPVDAELARALIQADPRIHFDRAAHRQEHPIEVEIPFLQRSCPACHILPILMSTDDEETVRALAQALLQVLPGRRAVVIASSDLSHYPTYEDALAMDGATLAALETGEETRVRETIARQMGRGIPNLATCACGQGPILVALRVAQGLGGDTVTLLRYANSGDTPYGSRDRVVGYGAVMFWRYQPPALSKRQRAELLALARRTLAEYLRTGNIPVYETNDAVLTRRSGAFITLKMDGQPRGCIGHLRADRPLYQAVQEMAIAAATSDQRFPALTEDELERVRIEISVLSPLRRLTHTDQIVVGTHGLLLLKGERQGVLLPQVASEQGWDRGEFLGNLCTKAGMPPDCRTQGAALYAFTAIVFGE